MTDRSQAIFISYASQDAAAASRICEALRAGGLDVWFDRGELRGGDAWDDSIRRQIRECSLFMPIISAHTQEREEGYFRREWNLAVSRTLDMAHDRAFLLPVVIDATTDVNARVPEKFRELQWTRLSGGETSSAFVENVRRVLTARAALLPVAAGPSPSAAVVAVAAGARESAAQQGTHALRAFRVFGRVGAVIIAALLIIFGAQAWRHRGLPAKPVAEAAATTSGVPNFAPPAHSIAVLPFENLSGDPKQDYFSDGLSEELLNSLATVRELQVAARASAFSFKGKNTKLADIARELNVGAVLEGSVRKEGSRVRITAELINTVTGFDTWSQTYDRDLKNILSLQSEIASAVTKALQAELLPDAAVGFELGGTRDAAAFDAYLQGEKLATRGTVEALKSRIGYFDEAIRRDPGFAKAYVRKAVALADLAGFIDVSLYAQAQAVAEKAVALAPELGSAHTALAYTLDGQLKFSEALPEHERALKLSPGDSFVLHFSGNSMVYYGHPNGLEYTRRAVELDPLSALANRHLASAFYMRRDFESAIKAYGRAASLDPAMDFVSGFRGISLVLVGQVQAAIKVCLAPPVSLYNHLCLGIAYHKDGQAAQAQAEMKAIRDIGGDAAAYQLAQLYAGWGDADQAIQWLQTAVRLRDPGLFGLKTEPLFDSVRQDPRFQSIEAALKFPD